MINKKEKIMHNYYLYYGISLINTEEQVFTLGISEDIFRRSYEKHMAVVWVTAYATRSEARKAETAAKEALDDVFDRAFVQFGAWQMQGYKQNRGWDWWLMNGTGPLDIIKEAI